MIEEEIFYPACEGTVEEDLLKESFVEHDAAKLLIAEIESGAGESDEYFDSKVKVLQEEIEHHVEEEEKPGGVLRKRARARSTWTPLGSRSRRGRRSWWQATRPAAFQSLS